MRVSVCPSIWRVQAVRRYFLICDRGLVEQDYASWAEMGRVSVEALMRPAFIQMVHVLVEDFLVLLLPCLSEVNEACRTGKWGDSVELGLTLVEGRHNRKAVDCGDPHCVDESLI